MTTPPNGRADLDTVFHKIIAADDLYAAECAARADRLVLLADLDDSRVWNPTAMRR